MSDLELTFDDINEILMNESGIDKSPKKSITATLELLQEPSDSIQNLSWAEASITNHGEANQLTTDSVVAPGTVLGSSLHKLQGQESALYSDVFFNLTVEHNPAAVVDETGLNDDGVLGKVTLPSLFASGGYILSEIPTTATGNNAGCDFDSVAIPEVPDLDVMAKNPSAVEETTKVVARQSRVSRKRVSASESSSVASQSVSRDSSCDNVKGGKKKIKMYEQPDKLDPYVQRAGYAKSYREKKKFENEMLKNELQSTKDELEKMKDKLNDMENTTTAQEGELKMMKVELKKKDTEIKGLNEALENERKQNSLNPQQTEKLLRSIEGVVKAACPVNSKAVRVIVSDQLANKKGAALGADQIKAICAEENLRNQPCTITFDIDEKLNTLTARKY